MSPKEVKILFETCATCGQEVVGDNTMTGNLWDHLEAPADHAPLFGQRVPIADFIPPLVRPGTPLLDAVTRARPADDGELSGGAQQMRKVATTNGFHTTATFAQAGPKSSVVLRMAHPDGRRAVATWVNGTYSSGYCHGVLQGKVASRTVKHYLKDTL